MMKKLPLLLTVFLLAAAAYSQPKLKSVDEPTDYNAGVGMISEEDTAFLKDYASNMVTIIPEGKKMELQDFAGTKGVVVVYSYSISKYEITQDVYKKVMGENPSEIAFGSNLPVNCVNWYDALYFCNKFSEMCALEPVYKVNGTTDVSKWNFNPHKEEAIEGEIEQDLSKNGYRLPTEVEWELAARGGIEGGWGNTFAGSDTVDAVAWYNGNSSGTTYPVGTKLPNAAGLYDMSGNVSEWCWDLTENGIFRYDRGGCFNRGERYCKVHDRDYSFPKNSYPVRGFRVVCSGSIN